MPGPRTCRASSHRTCTSGSGCFGAPCRRTKVSPRRTPWRRGRRSAACPSMLARWSNCRRRARSQWTLARCGRADAATCLSPRHESDGMPGMPGFHATTRRVGPPGGTQVCPGPHTASVPAAVQPPDEFVVRLALCASKQQKPPVPILLALPQWRCEETGVTDNLWLNLSTGSIGSGRPVRKICVCMARHLSLQAPRPT